MNKYNIDFEIAEHPDGCLVVRIGSPDLVPVQLSDGRWEMHLGLLTPEPARLIQRVVTEFLKELNHEG